MADLQTTIEIKAQDNATTTINKIKNATSGIGEAAKNSVAGVNALGGAFKSLLAPLAGFAGVIAVFQKSLSFASDLQEATAKSNQVFKSSLSDLNNAVNELTSSYGLNSLQAQQMLSSMGDLFKPLGFAEQDALQLSKTSVKLARDLASFNNLNTEDVLRDIQSALVGQTESVRKYGVVLNEAVIQQEALNAGLNPKNLTPAQKSWLVLNKIIKDNKDALGDYQRTQNSFANSLRDLQNKAQEFLLPLGQALMEISTPLLNLGKDLLGALQPAFSFLMNLISAVITPLIGAVITNLKNLLQVFDVLATFFVKFFGDTFVNLLTPIIKFLGKIYQSIINIYNKMVEIANKLGMKFEKVGLNIEDAFDAGIGKMKEFVENVKKAGSVFDVLTNKSKQTKQALTTNLTTDISKVKAPQTAQQTEQIKEELKTDENFMAMMNKWANFIKQFNVYGIILTAIEKLVENVKSIGYLFNIVANAFDLIAKRIAPVVDSFLTPLVVALQQFFTIGAETLADVLNNIAPLFNVIFRLLLAILNPIARITIVSINLLMPVIDLIVNVLMPIIEIVAVVFEQVFGLIAELFETIAPLLLTVMEILTPILELVLKILLPILQTVITIVKAIFDAVRFIVNNLLIPIINFIIDGLNAIARVFNDVIGFIENGINGIVDFLNKFGLGWSRWSLGRAGTVSRVSPIGEGGGNSITSATTTTATATSGASGMSVVKERDIYITFNNHGVLAGFKNEDEFITWLRKGLELAAARG